MKNHGYSNRNFFFFLNIQSLGKYSSFLKSDVLNKENVFLNIQELLVFSYLLKKPGRVEFLNNFREPLLHHLSSQLLAKNRKDINPMCRSSTKELPLVVA